MYRFIIIFALIFDCFGIAQPAQAQVFDIGLFNMPAGSNCFEVRVRPTASNSTDNWSATAFTIKWSNTYNVNLGAIQTNPYGFVKATTMPILNGGFLYQPFSRVNDQFLNWIGGQELVVMTICHTNSLTMGGTGTFEIINDAFTGSNNYNHYQEFAGEERTGIIYAGSALSPLPLELTAFEIKSSKNNLALFWKTLNEVNFKGFELERSENDANNFKKIADVSAKGGAFEQEYQYLDQDIEQNVNYYYRLKMNDFDGNHSYSHIRSGKITNQGNQILVSPNPVETALNIQWNGVQPTQISLMDTNGRTLHVISENAATTSSINVQDLPSGIYIVRVITITNEALEFKFIKK